MSKEESQPIGRIIPKQVTAEELEREKAVEQGEVPDLNASSHPDQVKEAAAENEAASPVTGPDLRAQVTPEEVQSEQFVADGALGGFVFTAGIGGQQHEEISSSGPAPRDVLGFVRENNSINTETGKDLVQAERHLEIIKEFSLDKISREKGGRQYLEGPSIEAPFEPGQHKRHTSEALNFYMAEERRGEGKAFDSKYQRDFAELRDLAIEAMPEHYEATYPDENGKAVFYGKERYENTSFFNATSESVVRPAEQEVERMRYLVKQFVEEGSAKRLDRGSVKQVISPTEGREQWALSQGKGCKNYSLVA